MPKKPTVAILGTRGYPSYYGGFETAVRHLAPYLSEYGWDVTVYSRPNAVRVDDPRTDTRVHVKYSAGIDKRSLSTLTYGFTSVVKAFFQKPDVALVMNVANCLWLPLLRVRKIPTLVNVDGIEWERQKWSRLARTIFRMGAWATARWADELVFDALAIGERWGKDYGRSGKFIPYGGSPAGTLPAPLALTPESYVLLVARFVPENSVESFFEAIDLLPPEVPVVLVGSTGYGGALDTAASELSKSRANVTWLGHVSDDDLLYALWQNAGAYFHGHTVGGTNPALVQAMALGAPIVAVDTVYNREVLDDAAMFTKTAAEDIARQLSTMLSSDSDRKTLSTKARERAESNYTWDLVNSRYREALETLRKA